MREIGKFPTFVCNTPLMLCKTSSKCVFVVTFAYRLNDIILNLVTIIQALVFPDFLSRVVVPHHSIHNTLTHVVHFNIERGPVYTQQILHSVQIYLASSAHYIDISWFGLIYVYWLWHHWDYMWSDYNTNENKYNNVMMKTYAICIVYSISLFLRYVCYLNSFLICKIFFDIYVQSRVNK